MKFTSSLAAAVLLAGSIAIAQTTAPAHDHGHDHAGHDHDHKGPVIEIGSAKVGGIDVRVERIGKVVTPGEEAVFIVRPAEKVKAVRAWVGVESGQGSIRTRAEEEKPGEWHAHHIVSKPLPANSKVWIEVEVGSTRSKASFDLK